MNTKTMLIIMDGWGKGKNDHSNAIFTANTPFIDSLYQRYANAELKACGQDVGLPDGQMGNSEVGHLNIGAGRIVYQQLARINKSIGDGDFFTNPNLIKALDYANTNQKPVHLIGLLSDGGVHSTMQHLFALIDACSNHHINQTYIHAFTDGRDTDPKSGIEFINQLLQKIEHTNASLASVCGRYHAMDRDKRWERTKIAYDLLTKPSNEHTNDIIKAIKTQYDEGTTDEFLKPIVVNQKGTINEGDVVIFFNFRTDRGRQLTQALTQTDFPDWQMNKINNLYFCTMTRYDESFENINVLYDKADLKMTLGQTLELNHKTQVRAAETEKYPHVTFFFSGGREKPFEGEQRTMVPSPKVATYDLQPQMSAPILADQILNILNTQNIDCFIINFANPDMVGHTGVYDAIVKAVETTDQCVEKITTLALQKDYTVLITADHGNAEYAINPDGTPNTAHTLNPVPIFILNQNQTFKLKNGILADIAPTILELMNLQKPPEMTGNSLLMPQN